MRFAHHFVGHDKQVELFRDGSNLLKFFSGENLANRVMGSVDDDDLGPRSDRTPANWLEIGKE